ncbi:MAG: 3'-5' exonuclease [bacterium]
MLRRWQEFVQQVDPDVITGYNIVNFDFPYIIERANALHIPMYPKISRTFETTK